MIPKNYEEPLTRFLKFIWRDAKPGQYLEIRAINDGRVSLVWANSGSAAVNALMTNPVLVDNVYFGVLPRKTRSGTKGDVADDGSIVWADLDSKQGSTFNDLIDSILPEPCAVVGSGHGWHAYWRLITPTPKEVIEVANQNIAAVLGSDSVADASRILRVPYTYNTKGGKRIMADVIHLNHECKGHYLYSFMASPTDEIKKRASRIKKLGPALAEGHQSRSERLFSVAIGYAILGKTDMDALERIMLETPEGSKLMEMSPSRRRQWVELTYKNARKTIYSRPKRSI